jgi:thiol-disulfide isomerase/thioredoxin
MILVLSAIACGQPRNGLVITDDSGSARVTYDCENPRLGNLESGQERVIQDYIARMMRKGAFSEPDTLALVMAAYESGDWQILEPHVVAHACSEGVLDPIPAEFPDPGTVAPGFTLNRLNGSGQVSLQALRGKYVIVDFWATWCSPCIRDLPVFEEWARQSDDLELLAVVFQDSPKRALRWVQENLGEGATVLEDPDGSVASSYGVSMDTGIPKTFLLDPNGEVIPACDSCGYRANRPHFAEILGRVLGWDSPQT